MYIHFQSSGLQFIGGGHVDRINIVFSYTYIWSDIVWVSFCSEVTSGFNCQSKVFLSALPFLTHLVFWHHSIHQCYKPTHSLCNVHQLQNSPFTAQERWNNLTSHFFPANHLILRRSWSHLRMFQVLFCRSF